MSPLGVPPRPPPHSHPPLMLQPRHKPVAGPSAAAAGGTGIGLKSPDFIARSAPAPAPAPTPGCGRHWHFIARGAPAPLPPPPPLSRLLPLPLGGKPVGPPAAFVGRWATGQKCVGHSPTL